MSLYDVVYPFVHASCGALFATSVTGIEQVPKTGGLVVASNHRSYVDPPLLGSWFPRKIHFMAKKELFAKPWAGWLLRNLDAFPVDRAGGDLGAIRTALKLLASGECVGVFPEGRRNLDGSAQARGGAVLLAAMSGRPVVPVALLGTARAHKEWRKSRVRVRIGAPLSFQGSAKKPTKAEVESWTRQLTEAIDDLAS